MNDLVDYVSESGEAAGAAAARYVPAACGLAEVSADGGFGYVVPRALTRQSLPGKQLSSSVPLLNAEKRVFVCWADGRELCKKTYMQLKPGRRWSGWWWTFRGPGLHAAPGLHRDGGGGHMKREFTCIVCPNGCRLHTEVENGAVTSVTGEPLPKRARFCRKGMHRPHAKLVHPR